MGQSQQSANISGEAWHQIGGTLRQNKKFVYVGPTLRVTRLIPGNEFLVLPEPRINTSLSTFCCKRVRVYELYWLGKQITLQPVTHNQGLRYKLAGNTAVSKSEENPSKSPIKQSSCVITLPQVNKLVVNLVTISGCKCFMSFTQHPGSARSQQHPRALQWEPLKPHSLLALLVSHKLAVDCTMALLFCFGQREKKKKPNKSKSNQSIAFFLLKSTNKINYT